ncbi:MAG TPA: replication-associated recombination protein A [Atribacterota bacterium]|nr:replication-associated recombination protein A [Atribacterota bacterium]
MDLFQQPIKKIKKLAPLADRMRPKSLDDFVGQEKIIGKGKPLRLAIERDRLQSVIFWGPPGSGKTTLAMIIAEMTSSVFVPFSAVTSGIPDLKILIKEIKQRWIFGEQRTILFVDEIHRFNKTQQNAFLPYVEDGTIILVGATTENPSFEVISPLLSRSTVYVLDALSENDLFKIIQRAITDKKNGYGKLTLEINEEVINLISQLAYGDARVALNILEFAVNTSMANSEDKDRLKIDKNLIQEIVQKNILRYDKGGEEHYNLISALHKSMRDSDPDAALYWVTRMIDAGEEPLYIARRLIRFASEDIGNADPDALTLAVSAMQAVHFLGLPEGDLALIQAAVYLANAPKSNALYKGRQIVTQDVKRYGPLPVPLVIRNAPTKLMKGIGYGAGYQYAHDFEDAMVAQQHLPDILQNRKYYSPSGDGLEKEIKERMEDRRKKKTGLPLKKEIKDVSSDDGK